MGCQRLFTLWWSTTDLHPPARGASFYIAHVGAPRDQSQDICHLFPPVAVATSSEKIGWLGPQSGIRSGLPHCFSTFSQCLGYRASGMYFYDRAICSWNMVKRLLKKKTLLCPSWRIPFTYTNGSKQNFFAILCCHLTHILSSILI